MKPFVDKLLNPRISRVPPLPLPAEQLPPSMLQFDYIHAYLNTNPTYSLQLSLLLLAFNSDYARGLLAPLCSDLKELPGPETLHARMTSIALEQGLVKGVTEEVVSAMLFATEVSFYYYLLCHAISIYIY